MNVLRIILSALSIVGISACALPGFKYQDGGSGVWRGQKGQPGYNPDEVVQIKEITPYLTGEMARQALEKSRASIVADSQPIPEQSPWVYHVGVGDVLSVIVWDHPELTNPAGQAQSLESAGRVVRPDGTIFYPHVGNIQVAGKTPEEISKILTQGLTPVIQSPQVDVTVSQFRSQYVKVVGNVDQPCKLPVTDIPLTVIDALNGCKVLPAAGQRDVDLISGGESHTADLYSIYKGHDPLLNEPLHGGDTLYVKDGFWNRVFVVGEVTKQAVIPIPVSGLTLADALNDQGLSGTGAGGLNQASADTRNIYVFRGGVSDANLKNGQIDATSYQPQVFHIDLKSPDALLLADQFHLQPRDVVYASSTGVVSYSRAVSLLLPTITTLIEGGLLLHETR